MKNTKQKIQKIAFELFVKKGYDGVSFQDIAEKAGITKAMLNYYFRNKENLLITIFEEALEKYFLPSFQILQSDISIEKKLNKFIDSIIETFIRHPNVPLFIANEINRHSKLLKKTLYSFAQGRLQNIIKTFKMSIQSELGIPEEKIPDPVIIITDILSLLLFPFIVKSGITETCLGGSVSKFKALMKQKKEHVSYLINLYIKNLKQ